jgi:hypothetical protein
VNWHQDLDLMRTYLEEDKEYADDILAKGAVQAAIAKGLAQARL